MSYTLSWIKNNQMQGNLEAGFSLVEMMIIIIFLILGILGGLTFPLLKQQQQMKAFQTTLSRQERLFVLLLLLSTSKDGFLVPVTLTI